MRESASVGIAAPPERNFGLVTDPSKLSSWNHAIAEVVEGPGHLVPGSAWKVGIHAPGQSWVANRESRPSIRWPAVSLTVPRLIKATLRMPIGSGS